MRLNKFIATNSDFSRRKADELIKEGKIFINNKKVTKLGTIIDPNKDKISIDNKIIQSQNKYTYIALNKPQNYICTRHDEKDRNTIMELVPKNQNLKPVGRLDKDSEGLILLSNDGDFINKYTHPSYNCEKEYLVKVKGKLTTEIQQKLEDGIMIENKKTSPAKIKILESDGSKSFTKARIIICEGRKRQIRKMFALMHLPVKYLQRIRIGKIKLNNIPKGKYRNLTTKELNDF